ncbi:AMP-binding protein [Pigmentiphaga sp. YJ18]|uniref:AMP-binding protein n=1 Tax=Pigmentiphaga sp. YJ18 TaxID=3134907 RepID=UPI0031137BB6
MIPFDTVFASAADAARFAAVPPSGRLPARDLPHLFALAARRRPRALAIRHLPRGLLGDAPEDWTFERLHEAVLRVAANLAAAGIGAGDTVAALLPNGPQTVAVVLGAQAVGVVAPINLYLEAGEIATLLDAMAARVLVADGDVIEAKLEAILAACLSPPRLLRRADLLAPPPAPCPLRERGAEQVALFHTGGTTGLPKLVPLTGDNFAVCALFSSYGYGYAESDRVYAAMPMFHVGGLLASALFPLVNGASIIIAGELGYRGPGTVADTWALAEREQATVLIAPPTVMGQLAQSMPSKARVPALRLLVNGAAALPVSIGNALVDRLRVPLTEPWGLTEACLAVTSMPLHGPRRAGSVGVALPYCRVKAVRVDAQGRETGDCGVDEIGVLAIGGPSVFAGYRGVAPGRQPFFRDGWLDTGDLGRVDADGHVWITGRAKDLIKRGGHGIDPAVIETALYAHPAVALAAAVGRPDAYAGELPVAYVQLKPGHLALPTELLALATRSITERAAVPKDVIVLDALPLTGVGKVNKTLLRLDAAHRSFEALLRELVGSGQRVGLEVAPHPRYGTFVRARVPSIHVEGARRLLAQFPYQHEVLAL